MGIKKKGKLCCIKITLTYIGFKKTKKKIVNFFVSFFTDSKNRNLTESVTDIKTTKYKENKTNISSTQMMEDLIKNIPKSTTVSIVSPKSLKSNKRNLTESDTCITKAKAKMIKTQHSSIQNFNHMDVHILPVTTASRVSPKSLNCQNINLIQSNKSVEMTKSKVTESNEHSTLVSRNVCPNTQILTQYVPEIEISEITESNMIDYYKPSTSQSIDVTVNNPPVIKSSGLSSYFLSKQKTISTQYNTDIKKTKAKIMESTPAYIDLTVDSPPDMRASSPSPNMFNGQSNFTQCNTQIECYEPSTLASIDLTVNNLPIMMNSRLSNEKKKITQYNNGIKIISSTSMSTDLSSNIPTFSSPSLRSITSKGNPALFCQPNVDLLVVEKDAQLSTINSNRIKRLNWRSPTNLTVIPKNTSIKSSLESALLPIALKRASKPNLSPSSKYPLLNKLLTRPTSTILKLDKKNTSNTPANVSYFYFDY